MKNATLLQWDERSIWYELDGNQAVLSVKGDGFVYWSPIENGKQGKPMPFCPHGSGLPLQLPYPYIIRSLTHAHALLRMVNVHPA